MQKLVKHIGHSVGAKLHGLPSPECRRLLTKIVHVREDIDSCYAYEICKKIAHVREDTDSCYVYVMAITSVNSLINFLTMIAG